MIGMTVASSTVDLISTYVAFELFARHIVTFWPGYSRRTAAPPRPGIKYFFLGTLSSGPHAAGHGFGLRPDRRDELLRPSPGAWPPADSHFVLTGLVLFFSGLFFKAALVPFPHVGARRLRGAPTPMDRVLSPRPPRRPCSPILIRVMVGIFAAFRPSGSIILVTLAILTMFWGNPGRADPEEPEADDGLFFDRPIPATSSIGLPPGANRPGPRSSSMSSSMSS